MKNKKWMPPWSTKSFHFYVTLQLYINAFFIQWYSCVWHHDIVWYGGRNILEENVSSIFSADRNQVQEVAGHTEKKGSHKVCIAKEDLVGLMGTADPVVGSYSNTGGRTVRMCTCTRASTWVVGKHRVLSFVCVCPTLPWGTTLWPSRFTLWYG
jgi:hypothetical protein